MNSGAWLKPSRGARLKASRYVLGVLALVTVACGGRDPEPPPPVATAPIPAAPGAAASSMPHGDHNPHHGGMVMMKGDLHFEVLSNPSGQYRVYFTDATRADLPAAMAQAVTLTIHRPNEPDEPIAMRIDDAGESWQGTGRAVDKPDDSTVRVAFTLKGSDPYWIDLPYRAPASK